MNKKGSDLWTNSFKLDQLSGSCEGTYGKIDSMVSLRLGNILEWVQNFVTLTTPWWFCGSSDVGNQLWTVTQTMDVFHYAYTLQFWGQTTSRVLEIPKGARLLFDLTSSTLLCGRLWKSSWRSSITRHLKRKHL